MSPNNVHMSQEPTGIRGGIVKFTTSNKPVVVKVQEVCKNLSDQMEHIHTWEDFNRGCVAKDLYGNTKHTDLAIIPRFFNSGLRMVDAADAIGYAPRIHNVTGHRLAPTSLMFRLRRMKIYNLFAVIQVFINKSLIPIETIREILRIDGTFTQKHATARRGKFYRYYAKWYVVDAIKYCQDTLYENEAMAIAWVALELGIEIDTVTYWKELEVEDIMVKPS